MTKKDLKKFSDECAELIEKFKPTISASHAAAIMLVIGVDISLSSAPNELEAIKYINEIINKGIENYQMKQNGFIESP